MTLPSKIAQAIAEYERRNPRFAAEGISTGGNDPVSAGDIRLVDWQGHDQYRHVLIVNVDSVGEFCEVLLLHNEIDFATEHDIILDRLETNAPYVLIAQTDIRSIVTTFALTRAVGKISGDLTRFSLAATVSSSSTDHRGTQLAGPLDIRWGFKRNEGQVLAEISEACVADQVLGTQIYSIKPKTLEWLLECNAHDFEIAKLRIAELLLDQRLIVSPIENASSIVRALSGESWSMKDSDFHEFLAQLFLGRIRDEFDKDIETIEISGEELVKV